VSVGNRIGVCDLALISFFLRPFVKFASKELKYKTTDVTVRIHVAQTVEHGAKNIKFMSSFLWESTI